MAAVMTADRRRLVTVARRVCGFQSGRITEVFLDDGGTDQMLDETVQSPCPAGLSVRFRNLVLVFFLLAAPVEGRPVSPLSSNRRQWRRVDFSVPPLGGVALRNGDKH